MIFVLNCVKCVGLTSLAKYQWREYDDASLFRRPGYLLLQARMRGRNEEAQAPH